LHPITDIGYFLSSFHRGLDFKIVIYLIVII
jgi:hypothetical protein